MGEEIGAGSGQRTSQPLSSFATILRRNLPKHLPNMTLATVACALAGRLLLDKYEYQVHRQVLLSFYTKRHIMLHCTNVIKASDFLDSCVLY